MTCDSNVKWPLSGEVKRNRKVTDNHYHLVLHAGKEYLSSSPGQFLMIRPGGRDVSLLGRPMSIYAVNKDGDGACVEVLYRVAGRGTGLMAQLKEGEMVGVVGPLGKGFTLYRDKKRVVLVAGGVGVAPLTFLAKAYRNLPETGSVEVVSYIGARSGTCIVGKGELGSIGRVNVSSDDGTCGHHGLVTDLFAKDLGVFEEDETAVYACGPSPMLKKMQEITSDRSFIVQASLEERMACGIGACLGCVVRVKRGGYARVCTEGPVFNLKEVCFD